MKTIRFTLGLLLLCALTSSGATYKGVIIGTNSTFTPTAGNDNRFNYGNTAAALVIRDNGDAYLLDSLGNVIMTYTNGAGPVFFGKSQLVNGGITGTEAGVPWNIGYLNAAGVPTNSPTGDIGSLTFAQLATVLGVFGVTNSIFGGTFGTNVNTGQTFIDAQGNISHSSTNSTFVTYGREGTNGTPPLLSVTGTNSMVTVSNMTLNGTALVPNVFALTNGFASYATNNAYTMSTTGFTNTSTKTLRIFGFAGTTVQFSNQVSATHFTLGTVVAGDGTMLLNPKETLVGTACSAIGIVDQ